MQAVFLLPFARQLHDQDDGKIGNQPYTLGAAFVADLPSMAKADTSRRCHCEGQRSVAIQFLLFEKRKAPWIATSLALLIPRNDRGGSAIAMSLRALHCRILFRNHERS